MTSPFPLRPCAAHPSLARFGEAELTGMCLEGTVRREGPPSFPVYLPMDAPGGPGLRALALVPIATPTRTFHGRTARWIHVGGPPPDQVEVEVSGGGPPASIPGTVWRFRRDRDDTTMIGGLRVATVDRTCIELLARGLDDEASLLMRRFAARASAPRAQALCTR